MLKSLRPAASALALLLAATAAGKAAADQYVFFGDSLTDSENSFLFTQRIFGVETPQSPPYFDGRFSNGPNWSDLVAPEQLTYADYFFSDPACPADPALGGGASCDAALDPGVQPGVSLGFAFGGARSGTDQLLNAPGFLTALDDLLGYEAAGRLADLSGATFVVWTGGNDYSNFVVDNAGLTEEQIVAQTIGNIETGLGRIASLDPGRAVVFNIFDLSVIPTFITDLGPAGAEQAGNLAADHNAVLAGRMDDLRRETGLDLVLVDVAALYADIYADPARYGFGNLTVGCIDETTLAPTGACPDAAATAATLYWDGTHPTAAAHGFIHQLFTSTLRTVDTAGAQIAVLADAPLRQGDLIRRGIADNLNNWRHATAEAGRTGGAANPTRTELGELGIFLIAGTESGERAAVSGRAGYRHDGSGGLVGLDYRPSESVTPMVFGVHAGVLEMDADIDGGTGAGGATLDSRTVVAGGFAGARLGPAALTAQITAMRIEVEEMSRDTGFDVRPTARGETRGWAVSGELTASLDLPVRLAGQTVWVSPLARLIAGRSTIDAYDETGAAFLDLSIDESRQSEYRGGLGATVRTRFEQESWSISPFATAFWETDLTPPRRDSGAQLSSGQAVATEDSGKRLQLVSLDMGLHVDLRGAITVFAGAGAVVELEGGNTNYTSRIGIAKRF